ncbi:glycosyltransferase [Pseudoduganella sp. R-34]|uniref:glycosyltransferase n=1 Tax=Pseudoduganella sp. R-34 TaxID=3404062 RepID=UPI003CF8F24B
MKPASKRLVQGLAALRLGTLLGRAKPAPPALSDLPPGFDGERYLELNHDVRAAGIAPAAHYLLYGRHEGRSFAAPPAITDEPAKSPLLVHLIQEALPPGFDSRLYLELNPDVQAAGSDPIEHFLLHGRAEGRPYQLAPAPTEEEPTLALEELPAGFDGALYLQLHPDLQAAGVDPVRHYLQHGSAEGRAIAPPDPAQAQKDALAQLPADFDPELYRKLHLDLADPAIDGIAHYLHFGRHEQRAYTLPALDLSEGRWQADRETVLVVCHEASRTGAPILGLNLVQSLLERYNVVAVLLGDGPLVDAFRRSGAAVALLPAARLSNLLARNLVTQLCQRYRFKFALVNSIVSGLMFEPLAEAFVPTIGLVHEFASYTRPHGAFRNALLWSTEIVFSAKVTMENAYAEYPDLPRRSARILPQGPCRLPETGLEQAALASEQDALRRQMRPPEARDATLVLGVGFVQLRKGVELFIECAARVARLPGGGNCRFVWIGKGYQPDQDVAYSVYLADQVRRAGLEQQLVFIDETIAIETAYEEADIMLLSSRLDPLPNVAIDALASRLPVLCFDRTTGIADFLAESGLREYCVADYLDTSMMASKVVALANDAALRGHVAARSQAAAASYFNMERYIASLEQLALCAAQRIEQERADTRTIVESGMFQPALASMPGEAGTLEAQVRRYVRAWASGIDLHMPHPGFRPELYREQQGTVAENTDPFAHYLRAGQPPGAWNC